MLDDFTDRSRRVLQFAKLEAKDLGDKHVGTEHILLGLLREGSGVAAAALSNLGVSRLAIQQELARLLAPKPRG